MPTMSRRRFVNVMGSVGATAAVSQVTPAWGFAATAVGATFQAGSSDALAFKTAVEFARMIRDKEISSVELTRYKLLDRRTDIWSFGCVLYEMLTGKGAFLGETLSDTLAKIVGNDPTWQALPADTPALLRRLLRRCLDKDTKLDWDVALKVLPALNNTTGAASSA